jgi:hypothetical protein
MSWDNTSLLSIQILALQGSGALLAKRALKTAACVSLLVGMLVTVIPSSFAQISRIPDWTYDTNWPASSVGTSNDGRTIVIGSTGSGVKCLDRTGGLLWQHFDQYMAYAAISGDGQTIAAVVHSSSSDWVIYLYNRQGTLLHEYSTGVSELLPNEGWLVQVSDTGNTIVANTYDRIFVIDYSGNLLWEAVKNGGDISSLALSENGNYVFTGFKNQTIRYFARDGSLVWQNTISAPAMSADASADGDVVAISTCAGFYIYSGTGQLNGNKWPEFSPCTWDTFVKNVAVSDDGSRVFYAKDSSDETTFWTSFHSFDRFANPVWSTPRYPHVAGVFGWLDSSPDGRIVVSGSYSEDLPGGGWLSHLYAFDETGRFTWLYEGSGMINRAAISANKAVVVAAFFGNTHPSVLSWTTKAWVSQPYLLGFRVSDVYSSSVTGDYSYSSTGWSASDAAFQVTLADGESIFLIGTAQVWNDYASVGSSIAITRDGVMLVSGDMFAAGATITSREIASAVAVDTPGGGSFTYALSAKTDPGGRAGVSQPYLLAFKVSSVYSNLAEGDHYVTATSWSSSGASLQASLGAGESLFLIGTGQLWNEYSTIGSSIAVCMDDGVTLTRASGDMFAAGATITHRELAVAIAVSTPGAGTWTYLLSAKTD